jgi:hypothetical protein
VQAAPLGALHQRLDEPRLAHAGLAGDHERAAAAVGGQPQRPDRLGQLLAAPDDRAGQRPRRLHDLPAGGLLVQRDGLRVGLQAQPRQLVAEDVEAAGGALAVAGLQLGADQLAVGLLVGRVLGEHVVPASPGAQRPHPPLAHPLARGRRPRLVAVVGQQLAAVGGEVAVLEALDVGAHGPAGRQLDHPLAQHDRLAGAQRAPRVVGGLVQVGDAGLGRQVRPQLLDHLVARQPVAVRERQQLHEVGGPPLLEGVGRQRASVDPHVEAPPAGAPPRPCADPPRPRTPAGNDVLRLERGSEGSGKAAPRGSPPSRPTRRAPPAPADRRSPA